MLEENIGAPCSLKYASSASNMPQIADQENASNIFKYIASQSASRLAQGMAQHIQKNPKR
jgi:predicted Zn-dependent protease